MSSTSQGITEKKPLFIVDPESLDDICQRKGEKLYEFFLRQSNPKIVTYREWIEELFQGLPIERHKDFCPRLRSDNQNFQASLFEMQMYRLLILMGLKVKIEPRQVGISKLFDFHVQDDKQSCIIEATVCGIGQGKFAGNANEDDLVAKMRELFPNPPFDIHIETEGTLNETISKDCIKKKIEGLLGRFTREQFKARAIACRNNMYAMHFFREDRSLEWTKDGWRLRAEIEWPYNLQKGEIWGPARFGGMNPSGPLYEAVKRKARAKSKADNQHGGSSEEPYIVAANNCHSEFGLSTFEDSDVKRALTGNPDAPDNARFRRDLGRVDAVIVIGNACLGHEGRAPIKLFRNENREIPDFLIPLEKRQVFGDLIGFPSHLERLLYG